MKEIISYGRFQCTELTPHKNRGMEITFVEKGMMEWMVEGVPEKVESGSVFFTLPWQVHGSFAPQEPDNVIWHVLFHLDDDTPCPDNHFRLPKSFGFTDCEMKLLSSVFCASEHHSFSATPAMRRLLPELVKELQSTHELRQAHAISLLRLLLVELKRIVAGEALDEEAHSWSEKKVQGLLTTLSSACDQQWTLQQMAEHCGIQRTRLTTIFQKLTGGTPMEYLFRLRMERAKTLLRETDMKIIDVAFECGFGSSQYFANTFKNAAGMTPTKYRAHCAGLTAEELTKWNDIDFRTEQEEHRRIETFSDK